MSEQRSRAIEALIALLLAVLVVASACAADRKKNFTAELVRVLDGDTCIVAVGTETHKIRLRWIDAPETKQPGRPAAAANLKRLCDGKPLTVTVYGKSFDRLVCDVSAAGVGVNAAQVRSGHAWVDPRYSTRASDAVLLPHLTEAKAAQRGLWSTKNPVAPWDWRRGKR